MQLGTLQPRQYVAYPGAVYQNQDMTGMIQAIMPLIILMMLMMMIVPMFKGMAAEAR